MILHKAITIPGIVFIKHKHHAAEQKKKKEKGGNYIYVGIFIKIMFAYNISLKIETLPCILFYFLQYVGYQKCMHFSLLLFFNNKIITILLFTDVF